MSNVVFVPMLIVSGIGLALYIFGDRGVALAANGRLIEIASFGVLLLLVGLNIRGLVVEKWLVNLSALGTLLTGGLLVGLAGWLAVKDGGTGTSFAWHPEHLDWQVLPAFSLTCFSLLGLEVASNVGGEICEPQKILPSAVLTGAACRPEDCGRCRTRARRIRYTPEQRAFRAMAPSRFSLMWKTCVRTGETSASRLTASLKEPNLPIN